MPTSPTNLGHARDCAEECVCVLNNRQVRTAGRQRLAETDRVQGPVAGRPDARTPASANRRGGHLLVLPEQVCKCREQLAWCFMTTFEAQ